MRRPPSIPTTAAVLAAVFTTAFAAAGCSGTGGSGPSAAPSGPFPVTVGDVTVDRQPQKIVSLSATATETLFAIGAGPQVVAVDDQSNYPPDAPKTDLSGIKPNAEAIAAKNPDLVVISNDTNKIADQLAKLKIHTYLAPAATTLDEAYAEIKDLGTLTGHTSEADDTVTRMRSDIAKLTADVAPRARKLTYFHELDPTLYSATSKTFIGSIYALFGLENVADAADTTGSGYPQLSSEALIKANPDLIFLADTRCCQQSVGTLKARPGFADVTAVRDGRVIELDDDIASRWGPRIVDLARAVSDAIAAVPAE